MKILKCIAWVIGINEYVHYPDLHAAVNDATEFADKLEQLGYSIQVNPREINLFYINQNNSRERIVEQNGTYFVNNTSMII